MKKLENSMPATGGFTTGFLVPTSGGNTGGVCLQPVRRRPSGHATRVVIADARQGTSGGYDATVAPLPGPLTSAPPIT